VGKRENRGKAKATNPAFWINEPKKPV